MTITLISEGRNDFRRQNIFNNIPENERHANIDDNNKMIECFLNLPSINEMPNPILLPDILNHQNSDHELLQLVMAEPAGLPVQYVSNT